jgi:hypothetical protein
MIQHFPRRRGYSQRRGYALVLVCFFVVLFLSLLGVAWRQMASALRIASLQSIQTQRDTGSIRALALGMQMLELRLCADRASGTAKLNVADDVTQAPASSDLRCPFACTVFIDLSTGNRIDPAVACDTKRAYKVAFDYDSGCTDGTRWSVGVTVATQADLGSLPAMPGNPP